MKANRLYLISLCAIAGLSLCACDDNNSKSCEKAADCGDANEWRCDIDTNTCMRQYPEHCANGKTDSGETDTDCGGTCVSDSNKKLTCGLGKVCSQNSDCGSGKCENKICAVAACNDLGACDDSTQTCDRDTMTCISCNDNTKNGSESDVDCGGTKCSPCVAGKKCNANSDCELGLCENGKCANASISEAKAADLLINEFMAAEDGTKDLTAAKLFPYNDHAKQCKFAEIINTSSSLVTVDNCKLIIDRYDDGEFVEGKTSTTALSGTVASHGVIVALASSCSEFTMAPGTVKVTLGNTGNITKGASYQARIECGEDDIGTEVIIDSATSGISMNRPNDMKLLSSEDGKDMVPHTTAEGSFNFAYASPSYCANGGLFSNDCKTTCGDGAINSDETDLDCGGNFCKPCETGKTCRADTDCESGNCPESKCASPKCTSNKDCTGELTCNTDTGTCEGCGDGVVNGDESDVDCGGSCSAKCSLNQKCQTGNDCDTGECTNNICSGSIPEAASVNTLVINEVMGSPKSKTNFTLSAQKETVQCEFVEIVNTSNSKQSLDGIKLNLLRLDTSKTTEIKLDSLVVNAKSALVVGECESLPVPDDVTYKKASLGITNSQVYELWLSSDTVEGSHVTRAAKDANGDSQGRNPDITGESLEFGVATPGYCRNGGLFSQDCAVDCGNGTETCGGTCMEKCAEGKACNNGDSDCTSDTCKEGVCAGTADPSTLIINEILDSGAKSPTFSAINGNATACEFIEIANPTDSDVKVKNMKLVLEKIDETSPTTTEIDLSEAGVIPAKNLLVVNNCAATCDAASETCTPFTVPSDAASLYSSTLKITGTWKYNISLMIDDKTSTQIKDLSISSVVNSSYNRNPDFEANGETAATMAKTTDIEGHAAFATPGFCANGKSYSSGCTEDPVTATE